LNHRAELAALAAAVLLLLLAFTAAGIAADKIFDTAPLALALGAGAGVLCATGAVAAVFRGRQERLVRRGDREDDRP
jgi:hypothetical protein